MSLKNAISIVIIVVLQLYIKPFMVSTVTLLTNSMLLFTACLKTSLRIPPSWTNESTGGRKAVWRRVKGI